MPIIGGIELEFEVDGNFLSGNDFTAPNFSVIGLGNYNSPIYWRQAGGKWIGKVTLYNADGIEGDFDILDMIYDVKEGVLGFTDVKLNYIRFSYKGAEVYPDIINDAATTEFVQWYSRYDLNKDGVIDLNDVTFALMYLMVAEGDPLWDDAKVVDFNGDGIIDIQDLLLILANYTIPYYG